MRFSIAAAAALIFALLKGRGSGMNALKQLQWMVLSVAGLIATVAMLVTIGLYILGPLDRAARHRMRPTQFTMVDFLSLMFLFQLPMAALHAFADIRDDPMVWFLDAFGWIACSLMWGFSVRTLSRAGIENTWHRGLFLAFVLPVAYFGSIVYAAVAAGAVIAVCLGKRVPAKAALAWSVVAVGLSLAFFLSAKFVRKMVAASAQANGLSDPGGAQGPAKPLATGPPGAETNVDLPYP